MNEQPIININDHPIININEQPIIASWALQAMGWEHTQNARLLSMMPPNILQNKVWICTPEDETYVTVLGVLPDFRRRFQLISIGIHDILLSHVSTKLGTSILKSTARG